MLKERKSFASTLRSLRIMHGLSQHELAARLHVSRSTYSYYESGRNRPNYEALVLLSEVFQVTLDCLLGKDEDTPEITIKKFYSLFINQSTEEQQRYISELNKISKRGN